MSFKFEIKDSVLLVRFGGDEFLAEDARELKDQLSRRQSMECIVDLKAPEVIEAADQLEELQESWRSNGAPMVFLLRDAHHYLFSEDSDFAGTHPEAINIIEEYRGAD